MFQFSKVSKLRPPPFKITIASLLVISLLAIIFSILVLQIQAGAAAYLSGLTSWSRGQTQTIRHLNDYISSGDKQALAEARIWYQIPLGDMEARPHLEKEPINYRGAELGLLKGKNHPDDIGRMIWLFRFFSDAPYFKDAVEAWRASDEPVFELGELIAELERIPFNELESEKLKNQYIAEINRLNKRLSIEEEHFRLSMTDASRAMVTILSFSISIVLILLMTIAWLLIRRLLKRIKESEQKFRTTFEKSAVGIVQLDSSAHVVDINEAFSSILSSTARSIRSASFYDFVYQDDKALIKRHLQSIECGDESQFIVHLRCVDANGQLIWSKVSGSLFDAASGASIKYILMFEDETEQHKLSEELHYQANHDVLTGLVNRRAFEKSLELTLSESHDKGLIHSLCFIDLDQFKVINDTVGHVAGDQLLIQVASLFSQHLRKRDILARLGGDEFALLLDCCEPESAANIAEAMLSNLNSSPFVWDGKVYNLGCSIGVVAITPETRDITDILQLGDAACYLAKEKGRNCVVLSHQKEREISERKSQMEWIERINRAVKSKTLFLDAQKIMGTSGSEAYRIEVLVRMKEGDNVIPPGAFIPAAERFGLAPLIDRWVIDNACYHLQKYSDRLQHIESCHINLSGRSFDRNDFIDFTINTIEQYDIAASKLCFEITETAAIGNLKKVNRFIDTLGELGCTFALDDFGAGLSSFSYLKQLSVDVLKIDGAFVRHLATDHTDRAMVKAIYDIGHSLGKTVVAEFVEDQQSLDWLRNLGVDLVQGYYIHRPEKLNNLLMMVGDSKRIKTN